MLLASTIKAIPRTAAVGSDFESQSVDRNLATFTKICIWFKFQRKLEGCSNPFRPSQAIKHFFRSQFSMLQFQLKRLPMLLAACCQIFEPRLLSPVGNPFSLRHALHSPCYVSKSGRKQICITLNIEKRSSKKVFSGLVSLRFLRPFEDRKTISN